MQNSRKLLTIGISVIVAMCLLVFGIDYLKGINVFRPSNYYFATFTNVTGLSVSAPVTANGFKVGQVREIGYVYDDPGHVKVELGLGGADLLGTATIQLQMPLSTDYLPVGSDIEARNSGGLMESVGNDLLPSITAIMPKIDSLLCVVTDLAADPALRASIQRLDRITANLETMTTHVAAATKPLPTVVGNAKEVTDHLAAMSAHLDTLTESLNRMPLNETMANVQAISSSLKNLTTELQSSDSSLGLLLHDPALYNNLNATVSSLDSLFIDIKAHPKRYLKFSVF